MARPGDYMMIDFMVEHHFLNRLQAALAVRNRANARTHLEKRWPATSDCATMERVFRDNYVRYSRSSAMEVCEERLHLLLIELISAGARQPVSVGVV